MRSAKTGIFLLCLVCAFAAHAVTITKLSVAENDEANDASINPSVSADGRFVVFESNASNLVSNDTNNVSDVFLADVENNIVESISTGLNGVEANGASTNPMISGNGRYVVFESFATNLVTGDTNGAIDIFVYDRQAQSTARISIASGGNQATSHSFSPSISDDGQVVAFYSLASNLVSGDTNRAIDVFIRDIPHGVTQRISVDINGNQANMDSWQPRISANGQYVVFSSNASNLVTGDTNSAQDIFLYDRQGPAMIIISNTVTGLPSNGRSAYAAVSGDGNVVVFESDASNLVPNDNNNETDIFVFDRSQQALTKVSTSIAGGDTDGPSFQPAISQDGRFVSFFTYASNLVLPDTNEVEDVFVYDRQTGNIQLLTNTETGSAANSSSFNPSLSADGRYVALFSFASNLAMPDSNNTDDVFVFDRGVINLPPVASAGNDTNVVLGNNVKLDGSGSFDPDGDPISAYQWQVVSTPANSSLGSWTSGEITPGFTPDTSGVFVISLTVSDGMASSSADEVFINVSDNLPPMAVISADVTQGYAPLVVNFNGSQSVDPESGSISWDWEFGDGTTSNEMSPVHVYSAPGSYLATLTVTDDFGNYGEAELRINVQAVNQPPEIIALSVTPNSGTAPLLTTLSLQVMDPENDSLSIVWDLGDGTIVHDVMQLTHHYTYPGSFKGSVAVSDGAATSRQDFVVNVDTDFSIKDTSYKIFIPQEKPQYSKFRFRTGLSFTGTLTDYDMVSLEFAGIEIFQLPFNEFHQVQSGIYVHKSRRLMITLDLNRQQLEVFKQRVNLSDANFKPFAGITLHFGSHIAVDELHLVEHKVCYRDRRRDTDKEYCPAIILKDREFDGE
jgi:PKD repeat protein